MLHKQQCFKKFLNNCIIYYSPILEKTGPLNIHLQGVTCMNDDPAEVKILFAQVIHNEKLQELVDKVADYFVHIGK